MITSKHDDRNSIPSSKLKSISDADFIDLKYVDLLGKLRHITFPITYLKTARENGVGFDSSSLKGFKRTERSDLVLMPDEITSFIDPFYTAKTLSFFAEIYYPYRMRPKETFSRRSEHHTDRIKSVSDENQLTRSQITRQRYEKDPRWILEKAINLIKKELDVDRILFLPELEFYVFNYVEFVSGIITQSTNQSGLKSSQALIQSIRESVCITTDGQVSAVTGAYHQAPPADIYADDRNQLVKILEACGVKVKYHHHEGGDLGQAEIETVYTEPLNTADNIILAKYIIRNYFQRQNKYVIFMPKPIKNRHGSGLHFHHILERDGKSLFKGKNDNLSAFGESYVNGILSHLASLCAFTNPTTNSYKRLGGSFETPREPTIGVADRTSAIRIPGYAEDFPIEYRVGDATCNPYLALAALLLAGLDGVRKSQTRILTKSQKGLSISNKDDLKFSRIPTSLKSAINALKNDFEYLVCDDVFPKEIIDFWIETKDQEIQDINQTPHPLEFIYYADL